MVSRSDAAPAPVAKLLEAANANDTDSFRETCTARGVVDDWGREFVGPDAIRQWSDREFVGTHVSLAIHTIERNGEATVVTADVGGEGFNLPEPFQLPVEGDRVSRMTIRA
jgi:hypothetical protein